MYTCVFLGLYAVVIAWGQGFMAVNELSLNTKPEDKFVYVAINPWQPVL